MTSLLDASTWRVPPGYRAVRTNERLRTLSVGFLSESRAQDEARRLNDQRAAYARHEWIAVQRGRHWQVTAYRLELTAVVHD